MMGMMMKIMIVESDHGTVNGAKVEPIAIKKYNNNYNDYNITKSYHSCYYWFYYYYKK